MQHIGMLSNGELMSRAQSRLGDAYAPHSNYHVGAAIVMQSGDVYTGVNIENDNYTNTRHAEEVAIMKAVDDGHRSIEKIAVVTEDAKDDVVGRESPEPCGSCKQTIAQFIEDSVEVVVGSVNNYDVVELEEEFQL